ncbi:glycosyltransferase family 39 protein [Nocardioides sp. SYSU D00038]|uniref:glycosyltransferase family 39 protein n=1 Tax=Nocardioides sp. SYSU D00038 TaxID=2812554 RepID=UPI001967B91E|nr:glycosyltransferase family 39 protein [Nocardioides sp. SYSU D00038]
MPSRTPTLHPVWVAAALAGLARLPALARPVRADEAGFLLVARHWDPRPDSLFGPYFVDRPPELLAVFRAVDALGGVTTLRLLGAVLAVVTVLLAAALARRVTDAPRTPAATAAVTAALVSTPLISVVSVKGELLALPLLLGAMVLALDAVRHRRAALALAAGVVATLALGVKQNLAGGLVLVAVLVVASWLTGRLPLRDAVRLGLAALLGAVAVVAATLGWAAAAGVHLDTLWDTVYGFRAEAAGVLAASDAGGPGRRALLLLLVAVVSGLLPLLAVLAARARGLWADHAPVVAATLAVLVVDLAGLVGGGSFWRDYLLPLVPAAALATALLSGRDRPDPVAGWLVRGTVVSAAVAMLGWVVWNVAGLQELDEADTGAALASAAEPGDTLVVYGGRADLQLTSGLDSPYPHLWSLPMRALDPDLADLRSLLAGPDAPTWLVEWWPFENWSESAGARLRTVVEERYVMHGTGCDGRPVWLRRGLARPDVVPDCH